MDPSKNFLLKKKFRTNNFEESLKPIHQYPKDVNTSQDNNRYSNAQYFLEQGQKLYSKGIGFYELAHENIVKSLDFDPKNYGTLCCLSSLLMNEENPKRDYTLAKKYLIEAISIKPNYSIAYYGLANLLSIKDNNPEKDYKNSFHYYLKTISLDKYNYQAYENLAKLLIRPDNSEKDYKLARTYFENLLKIDETNTSLYFQLGCLLINDDNPGRNYKLALENFKIAINLDKVNFDLTLMCGLICIIKSSVDKNLLVFGMNWLAKANRLIQKQKFDTMGSFGSKGDIIENKSQVTTDTLDLVECCCKNKANLEQYPDLVIKKNEILDTIINIFEKPNQSPKENIFACSKKINKLLSLISELKKEIQNPVEKLNQRRIDKYKRFQIKQSPIKSMSPKRAIETPKKPFDSPR